jgi:hypothetical protein
MVVRMPTPIEIRTGNWVPLIAAALIFVFIGGALSRAEETPEGDGESVESSADEAKEPPAPIEQEDLPVQDLGTKELTEEELQEGVDALEEVTAESAAATEAAEVAEAAETAEAEGGTKESEAREVEVGTAIAAKQGEGDSGEKKVSGKEEPEEKIADPWKPPDPKVDRYDWIQLSSGEWLKGTVERMRGDEFEFDSDELDDQTFDWEDVVQLRSPRRHVYRFGQMLVVRGPSVMEGDSITVIVEGVKQRFPRADLTAIVHGADSELDYWSGKINFSANFRSGNTEQTDYATQSWIRRETARNRIRLDLSGNYGVLNGEKSEDSVRSNLKWDIYWSRDFYITAFNFEGFRDDFANIERRLTPSAGVGYHILRGKQDLEVEALAGFQTTQFVSVQEGVDDQVMNFTLTFGVVSELELTKRIDFDASYRVMLTLPDTGDTSHNLVTTLSIELLGGTALGDLDLDIGFNFDRIENPKEDASGVTPKKNDYRLTIGLGLEF